MGAHRLQGRGSGCTSSAGAWQWVHIVHRGVHNDTKPSWCHAMVRSGRRVGGV